MKKMLQEGIVTVQYSDSVRRFSFILKETYAVVRFFFKDIFVFFLQIIRTFYLFPLYEELTGMI